MYLVCRLLLEKKKSREWVFWVVFNSATLFYISTIGFSKSIFFFFNDTATPEISPLSLHDALPICSNFRAGCIRSRRRCPLGGRRRRSRILVPLGRGGALYGLVDGAAHVERVLGKLVVLAVEDLRETADRLLEGYVLALTAGEHLGDEERLREEVAHPSRPAHGLLLILGELLLTQDRDDVLELLVLLEHALHALSNAIVLLTDDIRVQHPAEGFEWIHGRIDPRLRDGSAQRDRRAEVTESGGDSGVREVVRRHVDRLDRRDRPLVRRRDQIGRAH